MISNLKRFLSYTGHRKSRFLTVLIISLIVEATSTILFSFMNKTLFSSIENDNMELFKVSVILGILCLTMGILIKLLRYFAITIARNITLEIKQSMFSKLTKLDLNYFETNHSGKVLKKLNSDADYLKDIYFAALYFPSKNLLVGFVALIAMIFFSFKLTVLALMLAIISIKITTLLNSKVVNIHKEKYQVIVKVSEFLNDILSGFLMLKIYDKDQLINKKYIDVNTEAVNKSMVVGHSNGFIGSISFLLSMVSYLGTILVGIYFINNSTLDYGSLMAVISLQGLVSDSLKNFSGSLAYLTHSLVIANNVFDFLELDDVEDYSNKEVLKKDFSKGVEINNLTFGYDNRETVLKNFNLHLKENEKIMLKGQSGCGKSTILKLILRFYNNYNGDIKIFGNNIKDYSLNELRNMITYIPQDCFLFDDTIMENIKFGKLNATYDEVVNVSNLAYATEFIDAMEKGFDTEMVSGGKNVSGGQRQRIEIARAFLKDSHIILMDEPTSSLDAESESKINLAIEKLMERKIVILVSHADFSSNNFDRILHMKNGTITV